ncbi:2-hydroxyacyl-CoA dehydratase family protein [Methanobrevibacter sp.]|uniref:2-hydroxyacyl-CoA dehydratase family protein n=1 Tax=Methanobrevibacter sp. TaxID=66852 RepID=UPI003890EAE4
MFENVKISVDNFALIKKGEFAIDKIAVIKGLDGKGKSDLNRILFAFLITLSSEGDYATVNLFRNIIFQSVRNHRDISFMREFDEMIEDWDDYDASKDYLESQFDKFKELLEKYGIKIDTSEMLEAIDLHGEYKQYRQTILEEMLGREFITGRLDTYRNYNVEFSIDDNPAGFIKQGNDNLRNTAITYDIDLLPGNIIYLSPKPIMDFYYNFPYHYEELYHYMTSTHFKCKTDTKDLIAMIKDAMGGEFELYDDEFYFTCDDGEETEIDELPRKIKELGVLQILLDNKAIPEKSFLIIDNIDSRMDDEFQIKTAEILVKLAIKLDLLILVNTKSDVFADAFDKYSNLVAINIYEGVSDGKGKLDFIGE